MFMRALFFVLVAANVLAFSYYTFIREEKPSESVVKAKAELVNPVTVTNVSQELPPLIGKKK
jgi:hypothetical protein